LCISCDEDDREEAGVPEAATDEEAEEETEEETRRTTILDPTPHPVPALHEMIHVGDAHRQLLKRLPENGDLLLELSVGGRRHG
jgi:hypothetical protein